MLNSSLPEPEILKTILQPLLEDFEYWLQRSQAKLESKPLNLLPASQQTQLLERVLNAQKEISAARVLLQATEGQAILEMPVVMAWHNLVIECWKVATQNP